MRVLVPIKRVVDPYVKIHVKKDGQGVETQNVKMAINPFDEIALEEAIRWKEANIATEIVTVSLGAPSCAESLRVALALGADKALLIQTEHLLEPLHVAQCLHKLVQQHAFDIVIMGKQAIDDDCNQTGQMLATLLDWPQATFASQIVFSQDKKSVEVTREVDQGLEVVKASLPLIITTDLRLNEPRLASLPAIMQAKRKPLETIDFSTLDIPYQKHVEIMEVLAPPPRKAGIKVEDVSTLVHYLHDVEKVI